MQCFLANGLIVQYSEHGPCFPQIWHLLIREGCDVWTVEACSFLWTAPTQPKGCKKVAVLNVEIISLWFDICKINKRAHFKHLFVDLKCFSCCIFSCHCEFMPSCNISLTLWSMFWPTVYYNLFLSPFIKSYVRSPSYYADALFNVQGHLLSSSCPCNNYFFVFSPGNLLFILCPYLMALFNCMINNTELKTAWKEIFVYTRI